VLPTVVQLPILLWWSLQNGSQLTPEVPERPFEPAAALPASRARSWPTTSHTGSTKTPRGGPAPRTPQHSHDLGRQRRILLPARASIKGSTHVPPPRCGRTPPVKAVVRVRARARARRPAPPESARASWSARRQGASPSAVAGSDRGPARSGGPSRIWAPRPPYRLWLTHLRSDVPSGQTPAVSPQHHFAPLVPAPAPVPAGLGTAHQRRLTGVAAKNDSLHGIN